MIDLNQVFSPVLRQIDVIDNFGKRNGGGPEDPTQKQSLAYYHLRIPYYFAATQVIANTIISKGLKRTEPKIWWADIPEHLLSDTRLIDIVKEVLKFKFGKVEIYPQKNVRDHCYRFHVVLDDPAQLVQKPVTKEENQNRLDGKLLLSVAEGKESDIEKYMRKGANVNMRDPFKRTPLFAIVKKPELINLLVRHGANVNVVDIAGQSPLDGARQFGKPNSPTKFENVLLKHWAFSGKDIQSKNVVQIKEMVEKAKKDLKEQQDKTDKTALEYLIKIQDMGLNAHIVKLPEDYQ